MHKCRVCKRELPDSAFHKSSLAVYNYICKECKNKQSKEYYYKYYHKDDIAEQKKNEENFEHALGGYVIRILNHTKPFEHKYIIQPTEGEAWVTDDKEQFLKKLNELI